MNYEHVRRYLDRRAVQRAFREAVDELVAVERLAAHLNEEGRARRARPSVTAPVRASFPPGADTALPVDVGPRPTVQRTFGASDGALTVETPGRHTERFSVAPTRSTRADAASTG
jgi:hypothetical protein